MLEYNYWKSLSRLHKLEDNSRKIMDISECVVSGNGEREYRTLFRYNITKNELIDGKYVIEPIYNLEDNLEIDFIGKWHLGEDLNMNYYCEK